MKVAEGFDYEGLYRVQSKSRALPSRLIGRWIEIDEASSATMNDVLACDSDWWGEAKIAIAAAYILKRSGEFETEPDILYKQTHFVPNDGSDAMINNIVDVRKAAELWQRRLAYLQKAISPRSLNAIRVPGDEIALISTAEYFVHEAGHCIGYPTAEKYRAGYFRVRGKTVWPLVYVEELRADLLAFGLAASVFSPELARKVFWYNILLRFGTHAEHWASSSGDPYGSIPFMLLVCLHRCGLVELDRSFEACALEFTDASLETTLAAMASLSNMARHELVEELSCTPTDAAIKAAQFYRTVHGENGQLAALFGQIKDSVRQSSASRQRKQTNATPAAV